MKQLIYLGIVIFFTIAFGSCSKTDETTPIAETPQCIPADLQSGIIAFYPFSAESVTDQSGNNYNLTNLTTPHPALTGMGISIAVSSLMRPMMNS